MSEKLPKQEQSAESIISKAEIKQHEERLKEQHEKAVEKKSTAKNNESIKIRQEVQELAKSKLERASEPSEEEDSSEVYTAQDKGLAFQAIMSHTREGMTKPERTFSRIIHQPFVEKTSEVLGKTVARPSGVAGASTAAGIGLLSVYGVAKFAGFQLSGSEMPLLMVAGFGVGLFIEWSYKSFRSIVGDGSLSKKAKETTES